MSAVVTLIKLLPLRLKSQTATVWDDDDDERKGGGETQCRLIACSSRKAPRGPPGLTSPSVRRIAINSTICLLNIYSEEGF